MPLIGDGLDVKTSTFRDTKAMKYPFMFKTNHKSRTITCFISLLGNKWPKIPSTPQNKFQRDKLQKGKIKTQKIK